MFIQPVNFASNYQRGKQSVNQRVNYSRPSFKADSFDYQQRLIEKLNQRNRFQKFFNSGVKSAIKEVNLELIGFMKAHNQIVDKLDKTIQVQDALTKKQDKTIETLNQLNEELKKNLELVKSNTEKEGIIDGLKQKIEKLQNERVKTLGLNQLETAELNKVKSVQAMKAKREAGKGWDKIAGYYGLKNRMEEIFINKIAQEKAGYDVELPNGILLYGQSGTGKTRFAEAFAEEAQCNLVKIEMMQEDDDIIMDLRQSLINARRLYKSPESNKKRTIILLDDFNSIAKLSSEDKINLQNKTADFDETNVGALVSLLKNCAKEYNATIIMTTNFPRKLDSHLLDKKLISNQIFIGPPTPSDATEILKYHAKNLAEKDIDYVKLGTEISKSILDNKAYSAQGIVNIVEYARKNCKGAKITEADLKKALEQVPPNIDEKTFNSFLDDMLEIINRLQDTE